MKSKRIFITLKCSNCGKENYATTRNGHLQPEKNLEINKFCKKCNQRTKHKECKKKSKHNSGGKEKKGKK